jgi:hypothetical protein
MAAKPRHRGTGSAIAALVLAPLLCCSVVLLIGTGALAALTAIAINPWTIAAAVAVLAAIAWRIHVRRNQTRTAQRPQPNPSTPPHMESGQ